MCVCRNKCYLVDADNAVQSIQMLKDIFEKNISHSSYNRMTFRTECHSDLDRVDKLDPALYEADAKDRVVSDETRQGILKASSFRVENNRARSHELSTCGVCTSAKRGTTKRSANRDSAYQLHAMDRAGRDSTLRFG